MLTLAYICNKKVMLMSVVKRVSECYAVMYVKNKYRYNINKTKKCVN